MSLKNFKKDLAFDSFAQELRPGLEECGIELNYMFFDEPNDPACLHIGLDNDYALVQIVFWEGGKLELVSIQPANSENARKSEIANVSKKKFQEIVNLSINWLRDSQPVESLHRL